VVVSSVADPVVDVTPTSGELNCNVSSVLLTASVTGGESPFTYQWYKNGSAISGATSSTYSATSAGTYKVAVTDHNDCDDDSNDVVVTYVPDPVVNVTPTSGELNCNVSSVLLTASVTGGESPFTYQWYKNGTAITGATNSTYSATSAGEYYVVVTDSNDCDDESNHVTVIYVPPPDVSIVADDAELNCNNPDAVLTATVVDGEGPFTYQWYRDGSAIDGATNSTYTATSVGTYKVRVVDNNDCDDDSNEVIVTYVGPPTVTVRPTSGELNCNVGSVLFMASVSGGEGPFTYQWYRYSEPLGNGNRPFYRTNWVGFYYVVVTDANGCSDDSNRVTLTKAPTPVVDLTVDSVPECTGEACFSATGSGGKAPYTYDWDLDNDGQYDDFKGQSICHLFPNAGTHTVKVQMTDSQGCKAYDTATFEIEGCDGTLELTFDADVQTCKLVSTFTLTVENTGTCGAFQDIVVTLEAVEGTGYIASLLPLTWNVGDLPAGETRSTTIVVAMNVNWDIAPEGTVVRIHASVTSESCNPDVNVGADDYVEATRGSVSPDAYEADNSSGAASAILVDATPQAHNFHASTDVDWIRFNATAGYEYITSVFGRFGLPDIVIELYGPDMTLLATRRGGAPQITWTPDVSGTYYVKIYPDPPEQCECYNGYNIKVEEFKPAGECPCPEWLTFGSDRDGNWELYRLDPAEGGAFRLTDDPALDMGPTRSPDAMWIAFQSNRTIDWDIYKVDALGENLTRLTENAGNNIDPIWAPPCGTEQIAFQSDRDGNWEIYVMDGEGNSQTRLTNDPAADEDPFWSPGGMFVTFQSDREGHWDIYKVDLTGTNLVRLTDNPADEVDPVWSPDGKSIAFRSNREGDWNIYVMSAAGGDAARLSGDAVKVSGAGNNMQAVWSPDSQWLAYYSDRDGQFEVYAVNVTTLQEIRVTDNAADDQSPAWDCDSEKIVFQSKRDGDWDIYLTELLDTTAVVQLTDDPHVDAYPMWNPAEEDASREGLEGLYHSSRMLFLINP